MSHQMTQVLTSKMLVSKDGGKVLVLANPLDANYLGLPPKGTQIPGPGTNLPQIMLSIEDSDGSLTAIDPNRAAGAFEFVKPQNGLLVWTGWGAKAFVAPFVDFGH